MYNTVPYKQTKKTLLLSSHHDYPQLGTMPIVTGTQVDPS